MPHHTNHITDAAASDGLLLVACHSAAAHAVALLQIGPRQDHLSAAHLTLL